MIAYQCQYYPVYESSIRVWNYRKYPNSSKKQLYIINSNKKAAETTVQQHIWSNSGTTVAVFQISPKLSILSTITFWRRHCKLVQHFLSYLLSHFDVQNTWISFFKRSFHTFSFKTTTILCNLIQTIQNYVFKFWCTARINFMNVYSTYVKLIRHII